MISETLNQTTDIREGFSSMGISVDNLSMQETVNRITQLVKDYKVDKRAKLVATLNVDFIVNAVGYFFSRPTHPELLDILRTADIVTADGFPIVLLSKIMGAPLRERVTGADLVPALAERASRDGLSIYLLGGLAGSAAAAAEKLSTDYPGLKIAGTSSPMVHVTGDELEDYYQDDAKIVDQINASGADILFIGFGNPKQEQWFNRNRENLSIPVSIGIGGTFEFISGKVKRAPEKIQRLNLEWLYRISQDPGRLWRRYVTGIFKLGILTLPIIITRLRELLTPARVRKAKRLNWNTLWGSKSDVVGTVQLPGYVSAPTLKNLVRDVKRQSRKQRMLIIDFSRVYHIELAAYMSFMELGALFNDQHVEGIILGLKPAVRSRLESGRIMDACQRNTLDFSSLELPSARLPTPEMQCRSYVLNKTALIYLTGKVTGQSLQEVGFDVCVADMARDRTCIIDLRYADKVDSTAIAHFYRMTRLVDVDSKTILFSA